MNTTKKGDTFEKQSYELIKNLLESGKLGIIPSCAKVCEKPQYYSAKREGMITFDLSIEVTLPGAPKLSFLWLIECKNYAKSIPVDNIEEFDNKISQVSGINVKAVFITNNILQKSGYNIAKNSDMMVICLTEDNYDIILWKSERPLPFNNDYNLLSDINNKIEAGLKNLFSLQDKISGFKFLSAQQIGNKALEVLKAFDCGMIYTNLPIKMSDLDLFLNEKMGLKLNCLESLGYDCKGQKNLGYLDKKQKTIYIDKDIYNTASLYFVIAHELGHWVLHRNLKMNQSEYDNFKDAEYNLKIGKHELNNIRNFIEWQANQFAASFLMPENIFKSQLFRFQGREGIKGGHLNNLSQSISIEKYNNILENLSRFFNVSKTSIQYRLKYLNISMTIQGKSFKDYNRKKVPLIEKVIDKNPPEHIRDIMLKLFKPK